MENLRKWTAFLLICRLTSQRSCWVGFYWVWGFVLPGPSPGAPYLVPSQEPAFFAPSFVDVAFVWQYFPRSFTGPHCRAFRGFEKGLAGGGWRQTNPPKRAQKVLQKFVPLLLKGHRRKGTEKRPESLAFKGFPRANPLCPPTPFRNF